MPEINPYNIDHLKVLHGILTRYVEEESGEFRKGEEGVFNGDVCIFMAPPAKFVAGQMEALFQWMNEKKETVHPLILASVFHYEFVFIHPFAEKEVTKGDANISTFQPEGADFFMLFSA